VDILCPWLELTTFSFNALRALSVDMRQLAYNFDSDRSHKKFKAVRGRVMKNITSPTAKKAVNMPVCTVIRIILEIASSVALKPVFRFDKV